MGDGYSRGLLPWMGQGATPVAEERMTREAIDKAVAFARCICGDCGVEFPRRMNLVGWDCQLCGMNHAPGRECCPRALARQSRAYHDLRERIEEMRRTYKANDDLYKKTHVADIIMHLDHLLAEQEPTACHPACGPDYCAVDFCKREQEPTDGQR